MFKWWKRRKTSTRQYITVCFIVISLAAVIAASVTNKIVSTVKRECNNKLDICYQEMDENKRTVYVVSKDVMTREILTEDSVESKTVYSSQPQDTYIEKSDIGKMLLVDIKAGTQVLKSMVSDTSIDGYLREVEINYIMVSSNITENDTVDIRIAYPNGEDYTVVSKKILKGYSLEAVSCYLWLSEEEIIYLHNAAVDAALYSGAYLYTTKYIEPNLQDATVVTYTPSVEAVNLIRKNPNVIETATNNLSVQVRKALENRLAASLNKDVSIEQWDLKDVYIYPENTPTAQAEDNLPMVTPEAGDTENETEYPETGQSNDDTTNIINGTDPVVEDLGNQTEYPETGKNNNNSTSIIDGADLGKTNVEDIDSQGYEEYFALSDTEG